MKFYTNDIVQKAIRLKEKGVAVTKITKELGITRGTLLRWCINIPSNNANHLRNKKLKEVYRNKGKYYVANININKDTAKILAALIYWCEGYKYPNCNCIGFANSDINLTKTFLKLFRMGFSPKEDKLRAHLQMHDTHDKNEITSFWSKILSIPENQFQKPTITKALLKMKRIDYKGTCTVRYYDSNLYQEIIGTYEAFFKKLF